MSENRLPAENPEEPRQGALSRRLFMVGGFWGLALGAAGGMGSPVRLSWPEILTSVSQSTGTLPTFAFLDRILQTLGTNKVTLFPFLESTGKPLRARSYGGASSGTRILVAAGAPTAADPTSADQRYPYYHLGGVHSLYFHPGETQVENLHLAGEDHGQYEFPGNAPFSVGAWILPRALQPGAILSKWDQVGSNREWELLFDGSTRLLSFSLYDETNDGSLNRASTTIIEFNRWHFIVGTYDGQSTANGLSVYKNGAIDNGSASGQGPFAGIAAGSAALLVGATGVTAAPLNVFTGRIALPFICGKRLVDSEVELLYALGGRLLRLF